MQTHAPETTAHHDGVLAKGHRGHDRLYACQAGAQVEQLLQPSAARLARQLPQVVLQINNTRSSSCAGLQQ
jgi:hypothetical protein